MFFVTYDLRQDDNVNDPLVVRGVKEVPLPGKMIDSKIGEFEDSSGKKVFGVKIIYLKTGSRRVNEDIIEVPANAENVEVHVDKIPGAYERASRQSSPRLYESSEK